MDTASTGGKLQMLWLYASLLALFCAFTYIVLTMMPQDPVQEIILSDHELQLAVNEDAEITAVISPIHARYKEKDIVCTSSAPDVVKVISLTSRKDQAHTIKSFRAILQAKSVGEATITIETKDATIQSTCRITVK